MQATRDHGVRVLTDGAAALDPRLAADHGVGIVPMAVTVGGRPLADGAVPDPSGAAVRTSAPPPGRFLAAITEPPAPAGVVIITVAARLSASHATARLAAGLAAGPDGPAVEVVDSGSAAGGQALVALAAAHAAAQGQPVSAIAAAARRAAAGVRLLGVVGSMEALARGGRLPAVAATAGRLAGAQPLFELRCGRVRALRPAFSRPAALDRLVAAVRREARAAGVAEIAVSHAETAAEAEELLTRVTREVPATVTVTSGLGPAVLAHAGPGTLGLSWRWRPRAAGSPACCW